MRQPRTTFSTSISRNENKIQEGKKDFASSENFETRQTFRTKYSSWLSWEEKKSSLLGKFEVLMCHIGK